MSSADGSIEFLLKNIEQLQGLGKLETILPILEAMKVLMTEAQFDVSMINLTMTAENRAVVRKFLVDGMTTTELEAEGVSPSRLSKIVARVVANFHAQLKELDLVSGQYVLDSKSAQLVHELEDAKVSEAQLKLKVPAGRKKSVARSKAAAKTESAVESVSAENVLAEKTAVAEKGISETKASLESLKEQSTQKDPEIKG